MSGATAEGDKPTPEEDPDRRPDAQHFKTFRPPKDFRKGTARYNLLQFAKSLVRSGDLIKAVRLPPDVEVNHWLSVHTVDLYNITNVLYGSITEVWVSVWFGLLLFVVVVVVVAIVVFFSTHHTTCSTAPLRSVL